MGIIKKLDFYVFTRFVALFAATFFISSFILLMQFLWKHVNDIIGKGLDWTVIAEFFFYSSLTVVPLALPLAILLASLMTFGNLGEKMELTAMKAAGISLFRIMAPLFVFIGFVCAGAFFFSNNVLPLSQKRLWTLIFSLRQTSPELEIPQGEFYSGITGYNIYVRNRDKEHKLLKDVMIYDLSNGFANASVTVADSARMQMADDKTYLKIILYSGEAFENLKKTNETVLSASADNTMPYRRESFSKKEILIDFDANFAKMDESVMDDDYASKDLARLQETIDSVNVQIDQTLQEYSVSFKNSHFLGRESGRRYIKGLGERDHKQLISSLDAAKLKEAREIAANRARIVFSEITNMKAYVSSLNYIVIRHGIEWHRKFTLSFACLIFFFIGAPLGAIIRKGGLGVPVVISVVLFIVYYLIDNSGFKLAREDVWEVAPGIWLSSFCLLPLGLLFTYKAAKDSPVFNSEAYAIFWGKVKGFVNKIKSKRAEAKAGKAVETQEKT
ncbi:MAG: LptF/LptG family permease [Paludibacteraceae bacterium]|nr:LptF/LptG family permease [Paludibacteraceae bacterium]MBO7337422.1 LptF/LptG family permease [Paludibacteraceae bacterium]MBP5136936.1 LptF/LptG family permease [Paludibacteraceae bacterium]MBP5742702.1 LptF/LptG family permease [Paludibacteraceae bacterium]